MMTLPRRSPLLILLWCGASTARAAPAAGGLVLRHVVPPEVVLEGVSEIQLGSFEGHSASTVVAEVQEALLDADRLISTRGDIVDGAAAMAGDLASAAAGSASGNNTIAGLAAMAASGAVRGAAGAMLSEPIVLDDGLRSDVFEIVEDGGDALLSATISSSHADEKFTAKQKVRNADGTVKKNAKGEVVYRDVPCLKRTVQAHLDWKVSSPQGTLISSARITQSARDSRCGSDQSNISAVDTLAAAAVPGMGRQLADAIAPSWEDERLNLKRGREWREQLELVRVGDRMGALCSLRAIVTNDPDSSEGLLNYGVLHESHGWHTEAAAIYEQARSAGASGADKALRRVEQRLDEIQTLTDAYGLTYAIGAASYAECPPVPEGRPALARRDIELMSAPDGMVSCSLERNTRVFIVEDQGDWVRVATTKGEEGWVPAKRVK